MQPMWPIGWTPYDKLGYGSNSADRAVEVDARAPDFHVESSRRSVSLILRIGLSENRTHFSGRCARAEALTEYNDRRTATAVMFRAKTSLQLRLADVRFGSETEMLLGRRNVRLVPLAEVGAHNDGAE